MPSDFDALRARLAPGGAPADPQPNPADDPLLAELLGPELLRELVGLPYDGASLLTGHAHWELAEKEKALLARVTSLYLRYRVRLDPRSAVDFFMWGTLFAFTAPRLAQERRIRAGVAPAPHGKT